MKPRRVKSPEEVAQRKAAWAKVRHDVFPLWSNPRSVTNPFRRWDDWSGDDDRVTPATSSLPPAPVALPPPGPGSPFYVAPASDKALRRLLVVLCVSPACLLLAVIAALIQRQWVPMAIGVALLLTYGTLKGLQIRAVTRELSRRRAARLGDSERP